MVFQPGQYDVELGVLIDPSLCSLPSRYFHIFLKYNSVFTTVFPCVLEIKPGCCFFTVPVFLLIAIFSGGMVTRLSDLPTTFRPRFRTMGGIL